MDFNIEINLNGAKVIFYLGYNRGKALSVLTEEIGTRWVLWGQPASFVTGAGTAGIDRSQTFPARAHGSL